jgi:hypothetical protein
MDKLLKRIKLYLKNIIDNKILHDNIYIVEFISSLNELADHNKLNYYLEELYLWKYQIKNYKHNFNNNHEYHIFLLEHIFDLHFIFPKCISCNKQFKTYLDGIKINCNHYYNYYKKIICGDYICNNCYNNIIINDDNQNNIYKHVKSKGNTCEECTYNNYDDYNTYEDYNNYDDYNTYEDYNNYDDYNTYEDYNKNLLQNICIENIKKNKDIILLKESAKNIPLILVLRIIREIKYIPLIYQEYILNIFHQNDYKLIINRLNPILIKEYIIDNSINIDNKLYEQLVDKYNKYIHEIFSYNYTNFIIS